MLYWKGWLNIYTVFIKALTFEKTVLTISSYDIEIIFKITNFLFVSVGACGFMQFHLFGFFLITVIWKEFEKHK